MAATSPYDDATGSWRHRTVTRREHDRHGEEQEDDGDDRCCDPGSHASLLTEVALERVARGLEIEGDGERLNGHGLREGRERADLLADACGEARVENAIRRLGHRRARSLIGTEQRPEDSCPGRHDRLWRPKRGCRPLEREIFLYGRDIARADEKVEEPEPEPKPRTDPKPRPFPLPGATMQPPPPEPEGAN